MGALTICRLTCPVGVLGTALGHNSGVVLVVHTLCAAIQHLGWCVVGPLGFWHVMSYSLGLIGNLEGLVASWLRFRILLCAGGDFMSRVIACYCSEP